MWGGVRGAFCGILWLLAPLSVAAAECVPGPVPQIEIVVSESEPRFDYKFTSEQLARFPGNANILALAVYDITVNALSTGRMKTRHNLSFQRTVLTDKQVCVQVNRVDIEIHIEPVIYMARELRTEACEYKSYLEHEMKHVAEDRRLVNDYKDVIRRNVGFAFPQPSDFSVGPVPASLRKDAEEELSYNITGVLRATIDSMLRERTFRQREIDSVGEYTSLTLACAVKDKTVAASPPSAPVTAAPSPVFDINKPF